MIDKLQIITIRFLKNSEIKDAVNIVVKNYDKKEGYWANKELEIILNSEKHKFDYSNVLCAVIGNKIVGFVSYSWSWISDDIAELLWLNILPDYQCQGIGKMLVKKCIENLRKIKKTNKHYRPKLLLSTRMKKFEKRYKDLGFKTIYNIDKKWVLAGVKL